MSLPYSRATTPSDQPTLPVLLELVSALVNDDPLTVSTRLRDAYGYQVRIPPLHPALDSEVYLLSHPDDVQFVLQSHPSKFRALDVPGSRDFGRVITNSIVSLSEHSEEGSWVERLRLVHPEFAERAIEAHVPELAETTLATLAEFTQGPERLVAADAANVPEGAQVWTPGVDGVNLLPAMRRLTLRQLGVSLFGTDMRAHEVEIIDAVDTLRRQFKRRQLRIVTSYVTRYLPAELHLPGWLQGPLGADPYVELGNRHERRTDAAIETLVAAADAVVARREQTPLVFDDALAAWLRRRDPVTGERLSPDVLRQEVLGLLIAGHATTSAALTWAFYLLAAHPEVQERIHEEARATTLLADYETVRGWDDDEGTPDDVDGRTFLDSLPYTRQVWQETLRLYPALPIFGRTVNETVTVGDVTLDEGTHVLLSPFITHRDEEFWDDPETFDPDRFWPERHARRPAFAYFPFSGGRHACLGESIATTEALVVLATTLATHRIEFVGTDGPHESPEVGVDSAINLQPDRDIAVRFVPRG
ncbi:cytochrome P450 [Halorarius litoreus]|uniref:cytochrome P450 n=1 Tax=Halorarius litoreus TaxID=2962676 RepID=UPI0020CBDF06|nr:cytochrome P450 [Halorarius litoreus]